MENLKSFCANTFHFVPCVRSMHSKISVDIVFWGIYLFIAYKYLQCCNSSKNKRGHLDCILLILSLISSSSRKCRILVHDLGSPTFSIWSTGMSKQYSFHHFAFLRSVMLTISSETALLWNSFLSNTSSITSFAWSHNPQLGFEKKVNFTPASCNNTLEVCIEQRNALNMVICSLSFMSYWIITNFCYELNETLQCINSELSTER